MTSWLELLEKEQDWYRGWVNERAAIALVGSGVRSALRRYGALRSVDGSWRATRWLELPRILCLPLPERISAIWGMFPFDVFALVLPKPTAEEMRVVLQIVLALEAGRNCVRGCV